MENNIISLTAYYGAKIHMIKTYNDLMYEHIKDKKTVVDVFGGAGSFTLNALSSIDNRAYSDSQHRIYNDFNCMLTNIMKVLQDSVKYKDFIYKIGKTSYSKEMFMLCDYERRKLGYTDVMTSKRMNDTERAVVDMVLFAQSFNGIGKSFRKPNEEIIKHWDSMKEKLRKIHKRLQNVQICNESYSTLIPKLNRDNVFLFLDPPYYKPTRCKGATDVYLKDMSSMEEHVRLLGLVEDSKADVCICGYKEIYRTSLYNTILSNGKWYITSVGKYAKSSQGGKGSKDIAEEFIWTNFYIAGSKLCEA